MSDYQQHAGLILIFVDGCNGNKTCKNSFVLWFDLICDKNFSVLFIYQNYRCNINVKLKTVSTRSLYFKACNFTDNMRLWKQLS